MRTLDAYKVDAFTDQAYAGNPAGVISDADGLTDAQMQAIAREMNLSETAFVLPPRTNDADLRLRYFTPTTEVELCGHATVAAIHALVERGHLQAPVRLRVETNVGVLPLDVREGPVVFLGGPAARIAPSPWTVERVAQLLGLDAGEDIDERRAPMLQIHEDLFVMVRGLKALHKARPPMEALAEACRASNLQGVVLVSEETEDPHAHTQIRYFVPAVGIPEDPVTGVAHLELARYLLATHRIVSPVEFVGEQGHAMGRPGRVLVEVEGNPEAPQVRVGGGAVTVFVGRMLVPFP